MTKHREPIELIVFKRNGTWYGTILLYPFPTKTGRTKKQLLAKCQRDILSDIVLVVVEHVEGVVEQTGERSRWYVGRTGGELVAFKCSTIPTSTSHGDEYTYVIGPFKTKRGAVWAQQFGLDNPHFRNVQDAEQLARLTAERKAK